MGAISARSQASRPWGAPTGSESMASPRKATKTSAVKKAAKPDLLAVRAQIDGIARAIQSLNAERALFAHQVGTATGQLAAAVEYYRPQREAHVPRRVVDRNDGPLQHSSVVSLLLQIILCYIAPPTALKVGTHMNG